jgi:hypothetical protein
MQTASAFKRWHHFSTESSHKRRFKESAFEFGAKTIVSLATRGELHRLNRAWRTWCWWCGHHAHEERHSSAIHLHRTHHKDQVSPARLPPLRERSELKKELGLPNDQS